MHTVSLAADEGNVPGRSGSGRCLRCARTAQQGCASWCSSVSARSEEPEAPTSLVQGTQLGKAHVKVFPTCGEAVVVWSSGKGDLSPGEKGTGDPTESAARSARRARGRIRRYCVHNRLHRLWTLTYEVAEWDYDQVKADLARFFKALRKYRDKRYPYVWVIERHPKGHGLHVHVAMSGFIAKRSLQALWGKGIVHFSDRRKAAAEAFQGAELAAYFAKELAGYIAKEQGQGNGRHFYDVGQGFQPPEFVEDLVAVEGNVIGHVASMHFGGEMPKRLWRSEELGEKWEGPPVLLLYWYGRTCMTRKGSERGTHNPLVKGGD